MISEKEKLIERLKGPPVGADVKQSIHDKIYESNVYADTFTDACIQGVTKALNLALRINYPEGEMQARFVLSHLLFDKKRVEEAMSHVEKAIYILENKQLEYKYRAMGYHTYAYMHWSKGEYAKAFDIMLGLLRNADQLTDPVSLGWLNYALGVFNYDLKDYSTSLEYYTKARDYFAARERDVEAYGVARSKTGIASVYIQTKKYDEAKALLEEALNTYRELFISAGVSRVLHDLATIEKNCNRLQGALAFELESLKIRKETNHVQGSITSLVELGEIQLQLKDFASAENYLIEAAELAGNGVAKAKLFRAYFLLSQVYKNRKDAWKALEYYEKYHDLKEQVLGESSSNQIKRMQNEFAKEKSEKEAEIERLRNVELKAANLIISEKNKEILDSIYYAKRIQEALITNERYIERALKKLRV